MHTKTTWILGPLTVIVLAMSGCGDDSSGSSAASDTSAAASATTTASTTAAAAALMEQIPSPFVEEPQLERTFLGAVDDSDVTYPSVPRRSPPPATADPFRNVRRSSWIGVMALYSPAPDRDGADVTRVSAASSAARWTACLMRR